jgi:hypothetical protein
MLRKMNKIQIRNKKQAEVALQKFEPPISPFTHILLHPKRRKVNNENITNRIVAKARSATSNCPTNKLSPSTLH